MELFDLRDREEMKQLLREQASNAVKRNFLMREIKRHTDELEMLDYRCQELKVLIHECEVKGLKGRIKELEADEQDKEETV